ncbi:hypothetical protein [Vulcanisaeta souniana]|uniref:hypothetical protein n=1 Tax=Vulcanisaeta souniana TaxID=164452 RepID=UPI0006D1798A|nr:hypothetical protein [Vulcanisaeta souniana]
MPIWVYHLDEFRLVSDYDFNYTINELIGIAVSKAEELGMKPVAVCRLEIGDDTVIEVRGEDGQAMKLIKAKDSIEALRRFYENERGGLTCFSVS